MHSCCKLSLAHLRALIQNDMRIHQKLMELPKMDAASNPYGDGVVSGLQMTLVKLDMLIATETKFGEDELD